MIEVKECSKAFGTVKAVNKATLDVGVREVFGLVGSNGAGKSTLLRMMAGIIRPDEGEIQIDGMPVYENEEAKKLFFYISDAEPGIYSCDRVSQSARTGGYLRPCRAFA